MVSVGVRAVVECSVVWCAVTPSAGFLKCARLWLCGDDEPLETDRIDVPDEDEGPPGTGGMDRSDGLGVTIFSSLLFRESVCISYPQVCLAMVSSTPCSHYSSIYSFSKSFLFRRSSSSASTSSAVGNFHTTPSPTSPGKDSQVSSTFSSSPINIS